MSCAKCTQALPYLLGFPCIGVSAELHGVLYQCPACGAYYEQIGEEWRGPDEVTVGHVLRYYGSAAGEPSEPQAGPGANTAEAPPETTDTEPDQDA